MEQMRAVIVDPNLSGRLGIKQVASPSPRPNESLVRVKAISLNLGEVRRSLTMADAGFRPGWDLAGIVEQAAADGSGPSIGARSRISAGGRVGRSSRGAQQRDAVLPANVSFAQASTLPVAGLTALYSLELNGSLLGRRVLVTGASGGVGHMAVEMANHAGAFVVASVRRPEREKHARDAGAHEVVVGEDLSAASKYGPYDLILESIGAIPSPPRSS